MKVKDSVIWITGGTSGIGQGLADYFVKRGAKVAISGRRIEKGEQIASCLGNNCAFFKCDVGALEEIEAAAKAICDHFGRIDVLCGFAGMDSNCNIFDEKGDLNPNDTFRKVIDIDLIGSYDAARVAGSYMTKNIPNEYGERGCIIFCSSLAALVSSGKGIAGYMTTKTGLRALTRVFASELAPFGIRCNNILPGYILSEMTTSTPGLDVTGEIPGNLFPKTIGQPDCIALMAEQMIENIYLNKEDISVDAGSLNRY